MEFETFRYYLLIKFVYFNVGHTVFHEIWDISYGRKYKQFEKGLTRLLIKWVFERDCVELIGFIWWPEVLESQLVGLQRRFILLLTETVNLHLEHRRVLVIWAAESVAFEGSEACRLWLQQCVRGLHYRFNGAPWFLSWFGGYHRCPSVILYNGEPTHQLLILHLKYSGTISQLGWLCREFIYH